MIKDSRTDKPEKISGLTLSKVAQINKLAPSGLKFCFFAPLTSYCSLFVYCLNTKHLKKHRYLNEYDFT
jgi:hypothetical protein